MSATSKPAKSPLANSLTLQVTQAIEALKSYDQDSSRGVLVPLDEAVLASLKDEVLRSELEQHLVAVLDGDGSRPAKEYVCWKLRLMGSKRCVPALTRHLGDAALATAVRSALEAMPCREAGKALQAAAGQFESTAKAGVIISLGIRREPENLRTLAALLKALDPIIVSAALAAIGEIGSPRSGRILRGFEPKIPQELRSQFADAVLVCAERLAAMDHQADATKLYRMLAESGQPTHVKQAAERGLHRIAQGKAAARHT
jgi:HEAT repeat protein